MRISFPPISPFLELVQRAEQKPDKIILRDHSLGVTATAGQLLWSVSLFRDKLQAVLLQNGMYDAGRACEDKFIFLIALPGWEYVVSMLTIFSLGTAMSAHCKRPNTADWGNEAYQGLAIVIRPEAMKHMIEIARPLALLYAPAFAEKVEIIKDLCAESDSGIISKFPFVEIETAHANGDILGHTYTFEPNLESLTDQAGSLFFTSGTSGIQKGVVHTYEALLSSARERIESLKLTENDVILNQKPGNWMGGIFNLLPSLISGACIESCAAIFNPRWFWERVSQGDVSVFDIAPIGYDRLAQYFDDNIAALPLAQKEIYIQGITATRIAAVTGSLLPPRTQKRWTEIRRGKPLLNLYGSTEALLICSMRWDSPEYTNMCSVGPMVSGVRVKIVDGEMRLKSPSMFSRYLSDDPTATTKAFDSEGYFKTGDCVEDLEDCFILHGRANIDVFHFWGFTLHTTEIENALVSLSYILNAIVFPIGDEEHHERPAAALKMKPSLRSEHPDLQTLRRDLTEKTGLFQFKQPTAVYWLQEGEEMPLSLSGKISKKDAREKWFGNGWRNNTRVEILDLKALEYWRMGGQC